MGSLCSKRRATQLENAALPDLKCLIPSTSACSVTDLGVDPLDVVVPPGSLQPASYCPFATPSCAWLDEAGLSSAELARRRLVLRCVCKRILLTPPHQRPRSLSAFANFTRAARRIRTYTVRPAELLRNLDDVPEEVRLYISSQPRPDIYPECMLEMPDSTIIGRVCLRWNRLRKHGSLRVSGFAEQVRWIQSNAFVQRECSAALVAEALQDLRLFTCGKGDSSKDHCSQAMMSEVACDKALPLPESIPEAPWSIHHPKLHSVVRRVRLPAGCAGIFFGHGGAGLKSLVSQLQSHAQSTDVLLPLIVSLKVQLSSGRGSAGIVELKVVWKRWEQKAAAVKGATDVFNMTNTLAQMLTQHIGEIHQQNFTRFASHRERRAVKSQEWGRAYHEEQRMNRLKRHLCTCESAVRGLQLPPAGISRQFGAPRPNRKEVAQQRRRASLKQKRQRLLYACAELGLWVPACSRNPGHLGAVQTASSHYCRPAPCGTGATHRLVQHLHSCQEEEAEKALQSFIAAKRVCRRPKLPRQQRNRQQQRAMAISWG